MIPLLVTKARGDEKTQALSFSAFFSVYAALAPRRDERAATSGFDVAAVYEGAVAGAAAGIACHTVRFPLQTLYKRGRGYIEIAALRPAPLARRFASSSVSAVVSASLACAALEFALSACNAHARQDDIFLTAQINK